jgi:hypothetical protein
MFCLGSKLHGNIVIAGVPALRVCEIVDCSAGAAVAARGALLLMVVIQDTAVKPMISCLSCFVLYTSDTYSTCARFGTV